MSVTGLPAVVNDFNIYNSGNKLVGTSGETAIPDLEMKTETVSGAGLLGEIDVPVVGQFDNTAQEIKFRCINKDYFGLIDPTRPVELVLRGAIQMINPGTGATEYVGCRLIFRGLPAKVSIGTFKQGGAMDSSITLNLTYFCAELDGKKVIEVNKISPTYRVNGKDLLAPIKKLT